MTSAPASPPPFRRACAAALTFLAVPIARSTPPVYDHVVVVVEENRTQAQIIGDRTNAPYINTLADGGVSFASFYAITHPSQPNYIHLFSGDSQGVTDDNLPPDFSTTATSTYPWKTANLGAEIIAVGKTFAGYSEQLEAAGAADWADYDPHSATNPGVYYRRKHNPWANWVAKVSPIPTNQIPASVNRAFTQFPTNFTQLPMISIVVPNQQHDMHDGSRKQGDDWLSANLGAYATWAQTHNSLLIITWDEDDYNETNRIPTIFYGAGLRNGTIVSTTWTLHNLLRTLEDMAGSATHAGAAAQVRSIVGPFSSDPAVVTAIIRQGLNGYSASQDTTVWEEAPTANYAATHDLTVDRDTTSSVSGNQDSQALVRFDNLFGNGANQVPSNAIIHSAKLLLHTPVNTTGTDYDSDDLFRLHRMLVSWIDTATWDSFTGGVDANDVEAVAASSFNMEPKVDGGPAIFDVTADIEAWKSGATNHGWLIRPSSTGTGDGWTFKSAETSSDVTKRPTLEINYSLPSPFALWQTAKFGAAAGQPQTLELADPDADGITNLLEYSASTEPNSASSRNEPEPVADPSRLTIKFTRNTTATDLTYIVQVSSDATTWLDGSTYTGTSSTPSNANTTEVSRVAGPSNTEVITVRDNALKSAQSRRFLRLKIVK